MDDIRLFETDGDFLVLEAQDGQKFRLLIDDTVRSSVKREPIRQLDSISITPREIQEEIRNGKTIDELVKASGATFDFIEKFAAPVIAELEHIVSSALSVRLTIAGDRYNDSTQVEFGEIIAGRLVTSGATGVSWVAKKIEPNSWHITANYLLNSVSGSATWSFDPRRLTLSPESETAVTLSSQETLSNTPIPKLRTVDLTNTAASAQTVVMDDVIPIGRGAEFETPIATVFEDARPEPSTPAAFLKPVSDEPTLATESSLNVNESIVKPTANVAPSTAPEPLSATADLLEALRRKRTEREDTSSSATVETNSIRVIDIEVPVTTPESEDANQSSTETNQALPPASPTTPTVKKGRAAMPSWDEIVFGTKAED